MTTVSHGLPFSCDDLFSYSRGMVRRIARRFSTNADYEDLAQEAVLVWIRARERYDPDRDKEGLGADSWGRFNAHLSILKALTAQRQKPRDKLLCECAYQYAQLLENAGPESPESALIKKRGLEDLGHAISQLSQDERVVTLLRHVNGQSVEEVARDLGRSTQSVKRLLVRAKKHLRKYLAEMEAV